MSATFDLVLKGGTVVNQDGVGVRDVGVRAGRIAAIGSGGAYAKSAATALIENTTLSAREIVEKSMDIASKICIYTNDSVAIEEL